MNDYKIDKHLLDIVPYQPLQGDFDIRLDANESFLPLPEWAREEMLKEVEGMEFNRYPDPYAENLCEAFCNFHNISQDLVVAGNGSDELIGLILQAFLKDSASILTLTPDFSMYAFYAGLRRANVVRHKKNASYQVDISEIATLAQQKSIDILIFSNPCNPTGKVVCQSDIIELVNKVNCLVVVDEAYMDFSAHSVLSMVENHANLIVLRTMSKAFAAASLRVGFAVANKRLTNIIKGVKSPYNVSELSQRFGKILLSRPKQIKDAISTLIASKDMLFNGLCELKNVLGAPFTPIDSATNFVYIETNKAKEIYQKLQADKVSIRCFEDALRITAGTIEENTRLLNLLRLYK